MPVLLSRTTGDQAVADRPRDAVAVRWRAFELRPEPMPALEPAGDYLQSTWDRAVYPLADLRRMILRLPPLQPRSRMAFELAAFARDHGRFQAVHEALFAAFFEDGRDIGEESVLLDLGREQGLDPQALAEAIDTGRYLEEVFSDRQTAEQLNISQCRPWWCGGRASRWRMACNCMERWTIRRCARPWSGYCCARAKSSDPRVGFSPPVPVGSTRPLVG